MSVTKWSGRADSISGGKDYHCVLVETHDNRGLVIFRFGKKDQWGTGFQVEQFSSVLDARKAFDAKQREKKRGGYTETIIENTRLGIKDESELKVALGTGYWNKIGKHNLEWLVPGADTKGVREQKGVEWEQDAEGKWHRKEEKPRLIEEPVETIEDRAKSDPNFGLF